MTEANEWDRVDAPAAQIRAGFLDRHGKPQFYFRRRGYQSVRLPGFRGRPAFMAAYEAAKGEQPSAEIGATAGLRDAYSSLLMAHVIITLPYVVRTVVGALACSTSR